MDRTDMHCRVSRLNPQWWEEISGYDYQAHFYKAMDICYDEFIYELKNQFASIFISREIVNRAYENRFTVDPNGQIIVLDKFTKFQKQIEELEKRDNVQNQVKYCIFKDDFNQEYRIRCLSQEGQGFLNRKGLLKEWRGLS